MAKVSYLSTLQKDFLVSIGLCISQPRREFLIMRENMKMYSFSSHSKMIYCAEISNLRLSNKCAIIFWRKFVLLRYCLFGTILNIFAKYYEGWNKFSMTILYGYFIMHKLNNSIHFEISRYHAFRTC